MESRGKYLVKLAQLSREISHSNLQRSCSNLGNSSFPTEGMLSDYLLIF